jgi:glutaminyl-peptide cyclotransferase
MHDSCQLPFSEASTFPRPGAEMRLAWSSALVFLLATFVQTYTPLSNEQASFLKSTLPLPISSYLSPQSGSLLSPILIPRPSDSEGATRVLKHFVDFFTHNVSNWDITLDEFTDSTPRGKLKFTNFIATRDPPGVRPGDVGRLVLTAHYDSKWFAKGTASEKFIGATDSGVPCAMLMYAALALDKFLALRDEKLTSMTEDSLEDDPIGFQVSIAFCRVDIRLSYLTGKRL